MLSLQIIWESEPTDLTPCDKCGEVIYSNKNVMYLNDSIGKEELATYCDACKEAYFNEPQ